MSRSTFVLSFYSLKCWIASVKLLDRSTCFFLSILTLLSQYSELDCEGNKHEVGMFDKQ